MRPFLSVYGHVSVDHIISVDEFPRPNTSVDVLRKEVKLGGIASNIAVVAASLGVPTAVCAFVGTDFPKEFEKFIKKCGVITDEFVKVEGMDTSAAFIVNNSSLDQTSCFVQGAQGCASSLGRDLLKNAKRSSVVHFSTGDPEYYMRLMSMIDGAKITFDPAQEIREKWADGRFRKALELSDWFFCNEHEAKVAMRYMDIDNPAGLNKELVVCTKGEKGSEAYIDGKRTDIPAIRPDKVVDPTGAGDAYRAGFYAGLFRKYSVHESLLIASAASSFIVEAVGAQSNIPTWDRVMERADKELTKL